MPGADLAISFGPGDVSFMELMLRSAAVYGWVKLMEVGANLGDCTLWAAAHLGRRGSTGAEDGTSALRATELTPPGVRLLVASVTIHSSCAHHFVGKLHEITHFLNFNF